MKVSVTNSQGSTILYLNGYLDTSVSQQTMADIDTRLASAGPITHLVCDASGLTYISSSGLRILLALRKRFPSFCLKEVCSDVYQVLEMTGFTKMMPVERALRSMSVDGCEEIGRGGVGIVYRVSDDTIIKVFREGTDIEEVRREVTMAKEAFVLGMPTAISFDVVRVGNQYGLVYELLRAKTLSACIASEPQHIDAFARLYADLFRQLHSITVPSSGLIPSAMKREEESIRHISRYFDAASVDFLLRILLSVPQGNRLLHCDLQTKNAMMQVVSTSPLHGESEHELMLIDMGEVGYGHPLIDLGHAQSAMVGLIGDYEKMIGMPRELGADLWQRTMRYYFDGLSEADFNHRMQQIEAISIVRNFSWLSLSDSFPENVVRQCQEAYKERVIKRKDFLLDISSTFSDWTLS